MKNAIYYSDLVECQEYAEEAVALWKETHNEPPMNVDEAEEAVRKAWQDEWSTNNKKRSWRYIKERLQLIVDQIGFMVEV